MSIARAAQGLVFTLLLLLLLLFCGHIEAAKFLPRTAPDGVLGLPTGDFSNLWSAGKLVRHGHLATLYDVNGFTAWKTAAFGHPAVRNDWIYPPLVLPLGALFSYIPLSLGFVLWSFASLAMMVWLLRQAGLGWGVVALGVFCPAEWLSLIYGQIGGLIGCLGFAGLVLAERRPWLAGVFLGLVTLKPQTGFLLPFAVLAGRYFRTLLAAASCVLVLVALPLLWFGAAPWAAFLHDAPGTVSHLVEAKFGQGYQLTGTSVFWMLRSFGAGVSLAYAVQLVTAALSAAAVYRVWRGAGDHLTKAALTMFLGLYVAPYGFSVDLVGYSVALVVLVQRRNWRVNLLDGLLWLWPGYAALVTGMTGLLLTPLVVGVAIALAGRQLRGAHG